MEREKKFWEDFKFEFKLHLNSNLVCQRFFKVRGYNRKVLNSLELKEMMSNITGTNISDLGRMGIIPTYLKDKCLSKSWRSYNPYAEHTTPTYNPDVVSDNNTFKFEVYHDGNLLAVSYFDGNILQPSVRGDVDIREIIPEIIAELENSMSLKKYTSLDSEKTNLEYVY